MPEPVTTPDARPPRRGWAPGVATAVLLLGFGALLVVPSTATSLPSTPAAAFLPADATRGKVTLAIGDTDVSAELSDARLPPAAVPAAMSITAYDAVSSATRDRADVTWLREAVVPVEGSAPPRYRLRVADDRGVWLVAQDWGPFGLVLDGYLELPVDVAAGRTWSSSGTARARPGDGELQFHADASATVPEDASRAAEGCLTVAARIELTGRVSSVWIESDLWCPGKGVVAGQGSWAGTAFGVTNGGTPSPVTDADLADVPWDPSGLDRWRLRPQAVVLGDATFGLEDEDATATLDVDRPPVVAASGAVVLPTAEGGDLRGLVPGGPEGSSEIDLWAHWWARPGGQVTALAADGSLVLAPTTAHRLSAYRAGRTLAWNAPLDDVAVAPPLPVDDAVAVATVTGTLTLLDARSGATRWSVPLGAGVHTPLAAGDGVVVTADTGGDVTAWDLATGRQRWQVGGAADPYATTVDVVDRTVLVSAAGTVTAYAVATGARAWSRDAGLSLGATTTVGGQVWLDVGDDLQSWSVADGSPLWTLPGARPLTTAASACRTPAGTTLGFARRGGELLAVDGSGGVRGRWSLPDLGDDELTATCRGAGVDLAAYAPDGSRPLVLLGLAAS